MLRAIFGGPLGRGGAVGLGLIIALALAACQGGDSRSDATDSAPDPVDWIEDDVTAPHAVQRFCEAGLGEYQVLDHVERSVDHGVTASTGLPIEASAMLADELGLKDIADFELVYVAPHALTLVSTDPLQLRQEYAAAAVTLSLARRNDGSVRWRLDYTALMETCPRPG